MGNIKKMTPLLFWLIAVAFVGIIMLLVEAVTAVPASAAPTREQQDSIKKVLFPCWKDRVKVITGSYGDSDDEEIEFYTEEMEKRDRELWDGDGQFYGSPEAEYRYGISKEQSHLRWELRDDDFPCLSPERYRRRVKMFYGIDVNDYPADKKIQLTQTNLYVQELDNPAALSLYPFLRTVEIMTIYDITSICKWLFAGDIDAFMQYAGDGKNSDMRIDFIYAQYQAGIFDAREELIEYMGNVFNLEPNDNIDIAGRYFRYTDPRLDAIYMYIRRQETEKNRELFMPLGLNDDRWTDLDARDRFVFLNYSGAGWNDDKDSERKISRMLAHRETPWNGYVPEAGVAAFLNFLLRIDEGESLASRYSGMLIENNYFGYGLLRDFCEGRWRYSSLRAKMLESYKAKPLTDGVKLWLEPHPWAYDIDDLTVTDELTVTELGYDDYYFAEVMLPVETPSELDENGYSRILDRKEKVRGYVKRSEIAIVEKLKEGEGLPHENTDAWKKNPYLLLYLKKYKDEMTALTGALSVQEVVSIDCDMRVGSCNELMDEDTFLYWEVPEHPEYVIVQSDFNIRGFVAKSKVRQITEEHANAIRIALNPEGDAEGDASLLKQVNIRNSSRKGIIQDADGYVNIREKRSTGSKILGTIKDEEIFYYWELTGNWYVVQTAQGLRGFVYKNRIREYFNPQRWTINNE
jgi:hypothetical protein